MSAASSCIFCKIVAGEADASLVYQDEVVTAFMDAHPVATGHLLVVPNRHSSNLEGLDDESGSRMFVVGQRLAGALRRSGLPCEGVNLFLADGSAAGQSVFHCHLHVLPRNAGDGFGFRRALGAGRSPSAEDRAAVASRIRAALQLKE